MKDKLKKLLRAIAFLLVFLMLFSSLDRIFRPLWLTWNNHYTINGFYEEPRDTIETLFLGSSVIITGINPMQLYEDYGMCAYNMSTEQQSALASYYWMEEVYRRHSKSLKTVVMNASHLFGATASNKPYEEAMLRKALDDMRFSPVKMRAALDYTEGSWSEATNYLLPFTTYHTRWTELVAFDFNKDTIPAVNGTRGYCITTGTRANQSNFDLFPINGRLPDKNAAPDEPDPESTAYLQKMKEFCDRHGLNLMLIWTPVEEWTASRSNAIQALADQLNIPFLDFNCYPLYEETDYFLWMDNMDAVHPNHNGARKLTDWLGRYITETYGSTDVRGNPKYAHMEEQLLLSRESLELPVALDASTHVIDYLTKALPHDLDIFIMVRDDAAGSLTDEQREFFRSIGLTQLADLSPQDSYLGVIENGRVTAELSRRASETIDPPGPLTHSGILKNGMAYALQSGGFNHGPIASCLINGIEMSPNLRGINIVVYSRLMDIAADSVCFDTCVSSEQEVYTVSSVAEVESAATDAYAPDSLNGRLQSYINRTRLIRLMKESGAGYGTDELFRFLTDYRSDPDNLIILSVRDDASGSLDADTRRMLAFCGLPVLSKLTHRQSYVAFLQGENAPIEVSGSFSEAASYETDGFYAFSAGLDAGDRSSIRIDGVEYSIDLRGINAVVYNRRTASIVGYANFDTSSVIPSMPEALLSSYNEHLEQYALMDEASAAYGPGDLFRYLNDYWLDPSNVIFISARDDAASSLTYEAREHLSACGLTELAALNLREGYLACIDGGAVVFEKRSSAQEPVSAAYEGIFLRSAGLDAGNISSITIGGAEHSLSQRGLNIVVYSKSSGRVISRIAFDTCLTPPELPDSSGD